MEIWNRSPLPPRPKQGLQTPHHAPDALGNTPALQSGSGLKERGQRMAQRVVSDVRDGVPLCSGLIDLSEVRRG